MEDAILVPLDTHPLLKFPERDPQLIQSDHSLINRNETERTGCNVKNSYYLMSFTGTMNTGEERRV